MNHIDLELVCAMCGDRLSVKAAPNPACTPRCPPQQHAHARCDRCSPSGWFARVTLKLKGPIGPTVDA